MPSQRNNSAESILAAARESILAVGVRRTTLTDVARRADVSRMTVYRLFPDVTTLLQELMTREFGALLSEAQAAGARAGNARERLVASAVEGVTRLPEHELFRRLVEVDPELLLPYVVDRLGGTQTMAAALFGELIIAGQADGSVRRGDPALLAHTIVLALQSFVLSARVSVPGIRRDAVLEELRRMLDNYLEAGR